jgi:hypothetical protein
MIVRRKILNAKQTQVHPDDLANGGEEAQSSALLVTWPNSRYSEYVTLSSTTENRLVRFGGYSSKWMLEPCPFPNNQPTIRSENRPG